MVQQIKQSSIANFYLIQFQFKDVNVAIVSKVTSKNFEQVKLTWTDTSATFSHSGLFNGKLGILRKFKSVSFKLFMRGEEMYAAHFQVKPTTQVRLQARGRVSTDHWRSVSCRGRQEEKFNYFCFAYFDDRDGL